MRKDLPSPLGPDHANRAVRVRQATGSELLRILERGRLVSENGSCVTGDLKEPHSRGTLIVHQEKGFALANLPTGQGGLPKGDAARSATKRVARASTFLEITQGLFHARCWRLT